MEVDIAHGVEVGRSVPKAAWASDFAVASDNSSGNPLGPEVPLPVHRLGDALPEGLGQLLTPFGREVHRLAILGGGIDQPYCNHRGPVIETVATEGALHVVEARVDASRRWVPGKVPGSVRADDASEVAVVVGVLAHVCGNREDDFLRSIELPPRHACAREVVTAPELVEYEGIEAEVAGMHGLDVDVREQTNEHLLVPDRPETEVIEPGGLLSQRYGPLGSRPISHILFPLGLLLALKACRSM
jgi:hypothetical protein